MSLWPQAGRGVTQLWSWNSVTPHTVQNSLQILSGRCFNCWQVKIFCGSMSHWPGSSSVLLLHLREETDTLWSFHPPLSSLSFGLKTAEKLKSKTPPNASLHCLHNNKEEMLRCSTRIIQLVDIKYTFMFEWKWPVHTKTVYSSLVVDLILGGEN